jgi:hypothetical protein
LFGREWEGKLRLFLRLCGFSAMVVRCLSGWTSHSYGLLTLDNGVGLSDNGERVERHLFLLFFPGCRNPDKKGKGHNVVLLLDARNACFLE